MSMDPGQDVLLDANILVVDDAPANVALLTRLLRTAGVEQVHGSTDSREAVELWQRLQPDLVLLDLQMPHLDGFGVLAALRDVAPPDQFVPVLVLTADTTAATRDRALGAGANDFLTKPFDRTEVVLRVRNLLQTRSLYASVQQHNARLAAELDRRAEQEHRREVEQRQLTDRLERVLADGLLSMVFQPIIDLVDGTVVGVEALARFATEPVRSPDVWFQEAGRIGRAVDLELAAVSAALEQLDQLPAGLFLAVNVSAETLVSRRLHDLLATVPGQQVVLELTEHSPVEDYQDLLAALDPLRRRGVRVAVDDTGAGYAGLHHLLQVRPDVVKLDLALTRGIDTDPARRALATGLVAFAREIGAVVVAEGIENDVELGTLRTLEIGWGQGYHLSRPARLASALQLTTDGSMVAGSG
jgi:EAL domain-containing protein (putative c-di-GMP-specific phosphodiesterase class I)